MQTKDPEAPAEHLRGAKPRSRRHLPPPRPPRPGPRAELAEGTDRWHRTEPRTCGRRSLPKERSAGGAVGGARAPRRIRGRRPATTRGATETAAPATRSDSRWSEGLGATRTTADDKSGGPSTGQIHGLRWLRHPKARRGRCPQALRGDRTAAAPGTRGAGICGSLVPPRPDGLAGSRGSRASRHCRVGQASAARLPARRSLPRVRGGGDLVRPRCHRPHREGRAQERPGSVGHAAPRVLAAANEALA